MENIVWTNIHCARESEPQNQHRARLYNRSWRSPPPSIQAGYLSIGPPSFYAPYKSSFSLLSAVIDSEARASIVGNATLDNAMTSVNIDFHSDCKLCYPTHRFGPHIDCHETLFGVKMPFALNQNWLDEVAFNDSFDVTEHNLLFLIVLPTLTATRANINTHLSRQVCACTMGINSSPWEVMVSTFIYLWSYNILYPTTLPALIINANADTHVDPSQMATACIIVILRANF